MTKTMGRDEQIARFDLAIRLHRQGIAYSSEEVAERRAAVARLRELNRRGPV